MPEKEKREPLLSHGGVRSSGEASTTTGVFHALITTRACVRPQSEIFFLSEVRKTSVITWWLVHTSLLVESRL